MRSATRMRTHRNGPRRGSRSPRKASLQSRRCSPVPIPGASDGVIGVWRVEPRNGTATLLRELKEGGWPYAAAWSPDGRWIATGNRDRNARLWEAATGRLVLPPLYHGKTVVNVAFTPDG